MSWSLPVTAFYLASAFAIGFLGTIQWSLQ